MGDLIMFYDTETTGKFLFKDPIDPKNGPRPKFNDPRQPNLVQLGYKVVEPRTRETVFEVGHLVDMTKHETWTGIEPDAQRIHGIREELLRIYGSTPDATMKNFERWSSSCSMFIAHNDPFDTQIMQCFAFRSGWDPGAVFRDAAKFCTMKTSTNICRIQGDYGNKWPKLDEAYTFFNPGEKFKGAHNALADVGACENIFWHLVDGGHIETSW